MEVLTYFDWKDTLDTLGMCIQMAGKVMLERKPQEPEWEAVTLKVTPTGLTTGSIPCENGLFQIDFDFVIHQMSITNEEGKTEAIKFIDGVSVSEYYKEFLTKMELLGCRTDIYPIPQEWSFTKSFKEDVTHKTYDRTKVEKAFKMVKFAYSLLDKYAAPFRGKRSGINFWWGTCDMGATRYSGKLVPLNPQLPPGYRYGVDAELIEVGFNFGNGLVPEPYFFGFIFPGSPEYATSKIEPEQSFFKEGQYIYKLWDAMNTQNPEENILKFFQEVYRIGTQVQKWENLDVLNKPLEMPLQKPHRN